MDPEYISRKLSWVDAELRSREVAEDRTLQTFDEPLIILGDPGMGKTRLLEKLAERSGNRFIRAVSFLRQANDAFSRDDRLIIDGLDEVAAIEEGDPLHNVLAKLVSCGKPGFVISCRSIEWRSATGKIDIKDEYGVAPRELTLLPLSNDDAIAALAARVGPDRAKEAISGLDSAGLRELYENPLTLNFVASIVADEGEVPTSRALLYTRAVSQLRRESNSRHFNSRLARLSEDEALDAAGALCAVLLITGQDSIAIGSQYDEGLSTSDLSELSNSDTLQAVLGSNLFRTSAQLGHFLPMHRTVAEFLGARWLAKKAEEDRHPSRAALRLIKLISAEGGVPASLRGLHAWLPKFSPALLGPLAITGDPYGILRYGDGDDLSPVQARAIIEGLRQLARFDPFFRTDWRETISLRGLAQKELREDLRSIITNQNEPFHLRSLILEAINGSDVAFDLRAELEEIIRNPTFDFFVRRESAQAIANAKIDQFNWKSMIDDLIDLGDADSARLAVELPIFIDVTSISDELIAKAIVAHTGVLNPIPNRPSAFGSLYTLAGSIPDDRIIGILDVLASLILPSRDPEKWWENEYWDGSYEFASFADTLIRRQLQLAPSDISPLQLWNWMRALEREKDGDKDDRRAIAAILRSEDRLRHGVQRLALFDNQSPDSWFARRWHLEHLSGLGLSDADALMHLNDLIERGDLNEREAWMSLVSHFRRNGVVPIKIRELTKAYAQRDPELWDFLTSTGKNPKVAEWEKLQRKRERANERRQAKSKAKAREDFGAHIDELRRGDLAWIVPPARAYLRMLSDLRDGSPTDRLVSWLGEDLKDVCLEGFEATLHRTDLPTADQISESYADSKVWNFVFPMLAGAAQRKVCQIGFADLPPLLLSGLAIAAEHELVSPRENFERLKDDLEEPIRADPAAYEAHVRRKFEPMFRKKHEHVWGLYQFVRTNREQPLSTRLSLEWLERFELPLQVEQELTSCALKAHPSERAQVRSRLIKITRKRLGEIEGDENRERFWRSLHFLLDFGDAAKFVPPITVNNREWLWALTSAFYWRFGSDEGAAATATIAQLKWIVSTFRAVWPFTERPTGVTSGDQNPWDATKLLEWAMYQIAKEPSDEAAQALMDIRVMAEDGYTAIAQAAIASHHRVRLETRFRSPEISQLKAIIADRAPVSAADVQAIILSEVARLQDRLAGDPLNPVNNFYTDAGEPRGENDCRDQMLIALGNLPFGISYPPEVAMPQGKISDAAFVYGTIAVPLEVKGQWHKDLWSAASSQLDRLYSIDHKACLKGIYVVFWFGLGVPPGKRLKAPSRGLPKPTTPDELQLALQAQLPAHRRDDIAIVVLDLTR